MRKGDASKGNLYRRRLINQFLRECTEREEQEQYKRMKGKEVDKENE